jgi:signal transduction histidine kinase
MRLSLSRKMWLSLASTLFLAGISSGLVLMWAIRAQKSSEAILAENRDQASAIAELKIALVEQEALVPQYVLDPTPQRAQEIRRREARFEAHFEQLRRMRWEPDQRALIGPIGEAFRAFQVSRQQVLALAESKNTAEAERVLQHELRDRYLRIYGLCETLNEANNRDIAVSIRSRIAQTRRVSIWVSICLALATGLVSGLLWAFFRVTFQPLQHMADEAGRYAVSPTSAAPKDELLTLGVYLDHLKADVREARSHLAQSHDHLLDAEKLAAVGRLAAGVAHEIRSPLTSLRLRLFSMQKALGAHNQVQRDIQVMSDEITRLDSIIRNFLEFSRPPEIQLGRYDVALLLDKTLELLRHKIETCRIRVELDHAADLPPARVDAQQLRQVFLNLLNNAIDALPNGGTIQVEVKLAVDRDAQEMIRVRVRDNGAGIPAPIRERIFDPFFTTKEGGAGLGLWIAQRIMTEHGGRLELEASSDRGTAFAVWMPVDLERSDEHSAGSG